MMNNQYLLPELGASPGCIENRYVDYLPVGNWDNENEVNGLLKAEASKLCHHSPAKLVDVRSRTRKPLDLDHCLLPSNTKVNQWDRDCKNNKNHLITRILRM